MLTGLLLASLLASPPPTVPEVLNTTAVFSKRCSEIVYSSNRGNFYRPYSLRFRDGVPGEPVEIPLRPALDFFARSLSHDCKVIAAVSDVEERGRFQVFLIEKGKDEPQRVSASKRPGADEGEPQLSPVAPILAFLSGGRLALYDYEGKRFLDAGSTRKRFKQLVWSPDGRALFLVDRATSLWRFSLAERAYARLWRAPKRSFAPRMPWSDGVELLFLSDHESPFNQIYALDLASRRVRQLHHSPADKFSPRRLASGDLAFREARDHSTVVRTLARDAAPGAEPRARSPERGVAYDYSFDLGAPVLLFSDDAHPAALYRAEPGAALAPLVATAVAPAQPEARLVAGEDGASHLLYLPAGGAKPKGVVVWLHGGPHEDVSPRFSVYWSELLAAGHAVYALNYPGSTGAGNDHELRGVPPGTMLRRQVQAVEREVARLAQLGLGEAPLVLVGVSYGSRIAHDVVLGGRVRVAKLVDFSGIAGAGLARDYAAATAPLPQMLFVYGERDPFLAAAGRRKLLAICEEKAAARRVELAQEGHFVKKRESLVRIASALREFLQP